jgi:hypothetical protein
MAEQKLRKHDLRINAASTRNPQHKSVASGSGRTVDARPSVLHSSIPEKSLLYPADDCGGDSLLSGAACADTGGMQLLTCSERGNASAAHAGTPSFAAMYEREDAGWKCLILKPTCCTALDSPEPV